MSASAGLRDCDAVVVSGGPAGAAAAARLPAAGVTTIVVDRATYGHSAGGPWQQRMHDHLRQDMAFSRLIVQRAHRPPAPGQHPPQAQPVLPGGGCGLGRARRAGVSLA